MRIYEELKYAIYIPLNGIATFLDLENSYLYSANDPSSDQYKNRVKNLKFQGQITGDDAFDAFETQRINDLKQFIDVKIDDKPIYNALRDSYDKKSINDAIKLSEDTKKAKNDFKEQMDALKERLGLEPPATPIDVADYITCLKDQGIQAIKAQEKLEIDNIETLFKDATFIEILKDELTISHDEDLDPIKNDMIEALKKSHAKELSVFSKKVTETITNNINKFNVQRAAEISRLMANSETANEIKHMLEETRKSDGHIAGQGQNTNENPDINNEILKKLKKARTDSGILINNNEGVFSIKLPHRIIGDPRYYLSAKDNIKQDMKCLAAMVHLSGSKTIIMTVRHADDKYAQYLARKAYEACRAEGFDEKNITIKIAGQQKDISIAQLFSNHGPTKDKIEITANKLQRDREKYNCRTPNFMADTLKHYRNAHPPAPAPAVV